MSLARFKTIVIAVLVLVNAFFLAIIIIDNYAEAQSERQTIENVCAILYTNGITVDPGSIKTSGVLRTMRTAHEAEQEAIIANAFLGQVDMPDQGVISFYENTARGTAEFYTAGYFEIHLNEGVITDLNGSLRTVRELINEMKLETLTPVLYQETESETVMAVSAYRGAGVFNSSIEFVFSGGSLLTVKGRYLTGMEPSEDGVEISNVSTALLGFLAAVKKGEIECTEIQSVESGYHHSVVGSFGEGVISPVWLITTADWRYIVDSATGDIRQI